jgi:hypothetical protein
MDQNEINTIVEKIVSAISQLNIEKGKDSEPNRLNDLKERENRWHEISMNQLSFYNNLLIVLGTGFLAFVIKELKPLNTYPTLSEMQWYPTIISISITLMAFGIFFGLLCGFNRLVDFRYTHRVNNLKRKLYQKNQTKYGIGEYKENLKWSIYYWRKDADFFNASDNEYNDEATEVKYKIDGCSKLIKQLGKFTRNLLRIQIVFFLLSILAIVLSLI